MTLSSSKEDFLHEEALEVLALTFYSLLTVFERALLEAGFRTGGPSHTRGLPDWEGFARRIEPRFARTTEPEVVGSAAVLLAVSARTLEDVGSHYPPDRRFYQSDILWMARVIRTTGRRLAHGETLPWNQPAWFLLLESCLVVLIAWTECNPDVRRCLKDPWAEEDATAPPVTAV